MDITQRDIKRLTWSSRLLVAVLAVTCADIVLDKIGIADPIPDWVDLALGFGGLLLATFLVVVTERQRTRVRRQMAADREALAGFRSADEAERAAWLASVGEINRLLERPADVDGLHMVFQRIVHLATGATVGYEALARFPIGGPEEWFRTAAEVGLGVELELAAIRRALDAMEAYVVERGQYLSVNCSPATLIDERFWELFHSHDMSHLVVELTEHVPVEEYEQYKQALTVIRRLGARLAIDDAGAGYSSLRHIVQLEPDIVKVDRAFVEVDVDVSKRRAVQALIDLAHSMGATVIIEGVETEAQRSELDRMGASCVQGWLYGKPQSASSIRNADLGAPEPSDRDWLSGLR